MKSEVEVQIDYQVFVQASHGGWLEYATHANLTHADASFDQARSDFSNRKIVLVRRTKTITSFVQKSFPH